MIADYFIPELPEYHPLWDGKIKLESVPGCLDFKALASPLPCGNGDIPKGFKFDGSSSGIFRFLIPKWRHPIASCRHDFRCDLIRKVLAEGMEKSEANKLRKIADKLYREDMAIGQENKWRSGFESFAGYVGVRIGAYLGIGFRSRRT